MRFPEQRIPHRDINVFVLGSGTAKNEREARPYLRRDATGTSPSSTSNRQTADRVRAAGSTG
jgi:hypothetical protein